MASNPKPVLTLLLILNILLAIAGLALGGRETPKNSKNKNTKQPHTFFGHDGNVLVPGFGRVMLPKMGRGFHPITHNPFTGTSGGVSHGSTGGSSSSGAGGGARHNYVPGGDDTYVPNPRVEVPNPGSGGSPSLSP